MTAADLVIPHLVRRAELEPPTKDQMYDLLTRHFEGVARDQFETDLAEKSHVLLLTEERRLVGFSTLLAYGALFAGEQVNVVYSGDTIVSPEAWGSPSLARGWIGAVNSIQAALGPARCFWLLLSSGFRTYRFLPTFWCDFYPRYDRPTPPDTARFMAQLARARFGIQFDAECGVVRFARPQRLKGGLNVVPAGRMKNPHVAFFLRSNPGFQQGDELVCLTEISPRNLTSAGRRMVDPGPYALCRNDC